jgi:hypothetical protein
MSWIEQNALLIWNGRPSSYILTPVSTVSSLNSDSGQPSSLKTSTHRKSHGYDVILSKENVWTLPYTKSPPWGLGQLPKRWVKLVLRQSFERHEMFCFQAAKTQLRMSLRVPLYKTCIFNVCGMRSPYIIR